VMLFDEPTSALDPRMAAEVEAVIADLAASGQTMIVVTHSLRLARRTAHTLHVFDSGQVLESGPPAEIFETPRHESTRRFLNEAGGK
jgi:polar amino acid transport system ATP-binding protein